MFLSKRRERTCCFSLPAPHQPCEDTERRYSLQTRKRILTQTRPCWRLISDFRIPEVSENKSLLLKPCSLWHFLNAALRLLGKVFRARLLVLLSVTTGPITASVPQCYSENKRRQCPCSYEACRVWQETESGTDRRSCPEDALG